MLSGDYDLNMLVGILLVLLGVAAGTGALIPERYQRKYLWIVGGLTIGVGIVNLANQEKGAAELLRKIDRYGTVTNWQTAEATLEVLGPDARKEAAYALVIKIIPPDHERVKNVSLSLREPHSLNEPAYIDDETARNLFWIMQDGSGTIDVLSEYRSGIYTLYYLGHFDEAADVVKFRPDAMTYWPSLYPSLKDLEGKFVVARIVAAGVDQPIFTDLRLKLGSPAGARMVIFLPTLAKSAPGNPALRVPITSTERYIGGQLRESRFLPALQ